MGIRGKEKGTGRTEKKEGTQSTTVWRGFDRHVSHRLTALSIAPGWQA